MLSFAHYSYDNYILPISEAEKKYDKLKEDWESFHTAWIVAAVCIVMALPCFAGTRIFGAQKSYLTLGETMCWIGFWGGVGIGAFIVVVNLFYSLGCWDAAWHYKKTRKAVAESLESLRSSFHRVITETNIRDMEYGAAILPDYYLYPPAIEYMLKCIRNQQAATLGQAVTLYEQHADRVEASQKLEQIRKQLADLKVTTYNYYTVVHRQY